MRVNVLGCNGSISGDLSLQQAIAIDIVFLTHAHLDHCGMLPMLAGAVTARAGV